MTLQTNEEQMFAFVRSVLIKAAAVFWLSFFAQKAIRCSSSRATGFFIRVMVTFKAVKPLRGAYASHIWHSSAGVPQSSVTCPAPVWSGRLSEHAGSGEPLRWSDTSADCGNEIVEIYRATKSRDYQTGQWLNNAASQLALLQKVATWNFFFSATNRLMKIWLTTHFLVYFYIYIFAYPLTLASYLNAKHQ